jgi:hypothetical protein
MDCPYTLIREKIGEGAFGTVDEIVGIDGKKYAHKRFGKDEQTIKSPCEVDILFRITSPYLMSGTEIFPPKPCSPERELPAAGGAGAIAAPQIKAIKPLVFEPLPMLDPKPKTPIPMPPEDFQERIPELVEEMLMAGLNTEHRIKMQTELFNKYLQRDWLCSFLNDHDWKIFADFRIEINILNPPIGGLNQSTKEGSWYGDVLKGARVKVIDPNPRITKDAPIKRMDTMRATNGACIIPYNVQGFETGIIFIDRQRNINLFDPFRLERKEDAEIETASRDCVNTALQGFFKFVANNYTYHVEKFNILLYNQRFTYDGIPSHSNSFRQEMTYLYCYYRLEGADHQSALRSLERSLLDFGSRINGIYETVMQRLIDESEMGASGMRIQKPRSH